MSNKSWLGKKYLFIVFLSAFFAFAPLAKAGPVDLFVDGAPNVYGSSDWSGWKAAAWTGATTGTFVNMANSVNPNNAGTTYFELRDHVVYSFGDLGRRLHFVYWIPGQSISTLTGRFKISLFYDWDGVTYDGYGGYYGSTWLEPSSWEDYMGGVIGTAGWAWWGAYGVNTQEALDADLAAWGPSWGDITFTAQLDGEVFSLTAMRIPEPGTLVLFAFGLAGLSFMRRRRKSA